MSSDTEEIERLRSHRENALATFLRFLELAPNSLKQNLSGEEFAGEIIKAAETLQKYLYKGVIP